MSDERDDLERIIAERYHAPRPEPTVLDSAIAGAILAAGYRKPRQVTTIEELDALPVGSVILMLDRGYVYERTGDESTFPEDDWASPLHYVMDEDFLPATVLHVGGGDA